LWRFSLPTRALQEEKRLKTMALLQHRRSQREVSKLLDICQSKCYRICKERVPRVEPSRKGHPRSITHAQWRACVRAITIGGLNNVVDVRNASIEWALECGSEYQQNEVCTSWSRYWVIRGEFYLVSGEQWAVTCEQWGSWNIW
jgi:hypothetical protein